MDRLTLSAKEILAHIETPRVRGNGNVSPAEVGKALLQIRDKRLHREISSNFYDYCLIRFGIVPKSVDRFLAAAKLPVEKPNENIAKTPDATVVYFIFPLYEKKNGRWRTIR